MRLRTAQQIDELNEQLRLALGGVPLAETDPRIRVRQGAGAGADACELWGYVGVSMRLRRLCGLPAGIGLQAHDVEKAARNAGFPPPDGSSWRPIQLPGEVQEWFELPLVVTEPAEPPRHAAPRRQ